VPEELPEDDAAVRKRVMRGELVRFDPTVHGERKDREQMLEHLRERARSHVAPKLRQDRQS
jgi:hypothetical protein